MMRVLFFCGSEEDEHKVAEILEAANEEKNVEL